jgi:hypothetical protein
LPTALRSRARALDARIRLLRVLHGRQPGRACPLRQQQPHPEPVRAASTRRVPAASSPPREPRASVRTRSCCRARKCSIRSCSTSKARRN